jgi:hypothetical protein
MGEFDQYEAKRQPSPAANEFDQYESKRTAPIGMPMLASHTPGEAAGAIPEKSYLQRVVDPENMKAFAQKVGRPVAVATGATLGGLTGFAAPVPGGLAAGAMLGGGMGKIAADTVLGPEEPKAPRVAETTGQGIIPNIVEGISNIPRSAVETTYGALGSMGDLTQATFNPGGGEETIQGVKQMVKNLGSGNEWITNPAGNALTTAMIVDPALKVAKGVNSKVGLKALPDVAAQSERFKVPVTSGELTGQPRLQAVETLNEKVPFSGMTSFRETQHAAAKDAATNHFSQYVVEPAADSTAAMKISNDNYLDGLYEKVKTNTEELPRGEAPEVKKVATELLDRYPTVFESIQDNHIKKILQDIKNDTVDQTSTAGVDTGVVDAAGNPVVQSVSTKAAPDFSFDDLWTLRKGIGKEIGDAKTNTARGQLNSLYSAVSDDIDAVLSQGGDKSVRDFRAANDAFKQYSVKFDAMREAYDKAMGTTGAGEMFSPKKYSTALKNLAQDPKYKKNVKWSSEEIDNMTGLANIMQVVKRAGQFKENPPTGNRLADVLGVAALTKLPTLPLAWTTTFLTTTKAGKALVTRAANANPEGRGMANIVNSIVQNAQKTIKDERGLVGTDIGKESVKYSQGENDGKTANVRSPDGIRPNGDIEAPAVDNGLVPGDGGRGVANPLRENQGDMAAGKNSGEGGSLRTASPEVLHDYASKAVNGLRDAIERTNNSKLDERSFGPDFSRDTTGIDKIAGVFGKKVVFVKGESVKFEGAVDRAQPDVIFIKSGTFEPHLAIVGHELFHHMVQDMPDVAGDFAEAIGPYVKGFGEYKRNHPGGGDTNALAEEFSADLMGNQFTTRKFWDELSSKSPSTFERVVEYISNFIESVQTEYHNAIGIGKTSAKHITDLDKVRDAAVRAYNAYARKQGIAEAQKVTDANGIKYTFPSTGYAEGGMVDYDMAGYQEKHGQPVMRTPGQHFSDEFKYPNHMTFSDQSKYSTPEQQGGRWAQLPGSGIPGNIGSDQWHFYASPFNVKQHGAEKLQQYFKEKEPGNVLHLPNDQGGYEEGGMVSDTLRPSIKFQGKQIDGTLDQHHDDILAANKIGSKQKHERGFVADNKFMSREEASAYMKDQGYQEVPDSLHTQQLRELLKKGKTDDSQQGSAKETKKKVDRRKARKELMSES